jgi:Zn-dependent M28 family amino/carboxypeptidase
MMGSDQLEAQLHDDVQRLAQDIGERNFRHYARLGEAAQFIEHAWRDAGYTPVRQAYEVRGQHFANLIAERRGTAWPSRILVIGAHYDAARGSPGANDNASGVAALLALARAFADQGLTQTVRFVAFTNEERPFLRTAAMGSRVYAQHCREAHERIAGMLSLETIGYCATQPGSQRLSFFGLLTPRVENFIALVANPRSRALLRAVRDAFRQHTRIGCATITLPTSFPGAWSSDHWAFWKAGYPALMVTDTAPLRYPFYHTPADTPDKLRYDFLTGVVHGLHGVVATLAG